MGPRVPRRGMRYRFGPHLLDLGARQLLRAGVPVEVEPRTFAVLAHLVRSRDRVVTKEELLDEVWGDRFVGEAALTTQIKQARVAVGDDGRTQRTIATAHRVGYRFVADVVEEASAGDAAPPVDVPGRWYPSEAKELFGREADITSVVERLEDQRLVTVTGPGGVGKTALASRALASVAGLAPDGVWLCELAKAREPSAVTSVVLAGIGEGQQSDASPAVSLLRTLERRRTILVLDGCEHVLPATSSLVSTLLEQCPGLRVLATSRTPLGVEGESVQPVGPLSLPSAIECFVARAADAGATVRPDDPSLSELCRRLDCLPLALELAAARARHLSPRETLELLTDRFRLLRTTPSDGHDDRHGSLHRTITWSWDLLAREDRRTLARLSVFVGSFRLEDARHVAFGDGADPLDAADVLGRLVSCSLLVAAPDELGRTRFRLLDSVRDFAAGQLEDVASARRRHVDHFAAHAEVLDAALQTAGIDEAVAEMGDAWDNLRAAVGYAAEVGDLRPLRRIVRAVGPYADLFQVYEVLDWCELAGLDPALDVEEDDLAVTADAAAVEARMLAHRGEHERARALATRAHERRESHATLLSVVWCAYYAGDLDLVMASADRLVQLSRSARGFDRGFADGFSAMVAAVRQQGGAASTPVVPDDAERGVLGALDCLTAGLLLCASEPRRAAPLLEAVVDAGLRHDYRLLLGAAASTLTQVALPGQPPIDAMRTLRRTLQRYVDRSMWVLISADVVMAAALLAEHGETETACRLLGARRASGYAVGLSEVLRAQLEEHLEQQLGGSFAALSAQGARWRPPDAAEAAIAALDRALDAAARRPPLTGGD